MKTGASRNQIISPPAPAVDRDHGRMVAIGRYILTVRILHWIVTFLMVAAIGLGLYGDGLPYGSGEASARSTFVYALHESLMQAMSGSVAQIL